MYSAEPARNEGLGSLFVGKIGPGPVLLSALFLVSLMVLPTFFLPTHVPLTQNIFFAVSAAVILIFSRAGVALFRKKLGGLTGDTLGAVSEISEVIFLFMVILWSRLFI